MRHARPKGCERKVRVSVVRAKVGEQIAMGGETDDNPAKEHSVNPFREFGVE